MGDNIYNQDPISVKRKGLNSEVQFANNGGDDLDSHPNVYVTSDGGLNATYFTGDGGNLSNVIGPGTSNNLAYFNSENTITSADTLIFNPDNGSLIINANLRVEGTTYTANNVTMQDVILLLADEAPDGTDMGIIMQRPSGNVAVGYEGVSNNLVISYTESGGDSMFLTPDTTKNLPVDIYGNVHIISTGTDTSLTTSNNIVVSGTGIFENPTTSIQTDLTSNVLIKLDQLSNVVIDTPVDQHTLVYNGSNWINEYPQSTFIMAKKNDPGETINKGDAVYIVEAQNENVVKVSLAKASESSKMPCIGLAVEDFINNDTHPIVTFGKAKGIDTSGFEEGEILYVSNVVEGGLSNVKPLNTNGLTGPDLIQNVGFVVKADATNGTIKVTGVGRANDIPNAEILPDETSVNYVYVNTSGNDLKKIDPQFLTTNVHTLEQVTSVGNTTSNTVYFQNDTLSFKADSSIEVGTANLFVDTTTGRVGIGTDDPERTLHVNSKGGQGIAAFQNSNVGCVVQANSGNLNQIEIVGYTQETNEQTNGGGNYSNIFIRTESDGIYIQQGSGSVGIGTTNPDSNYRVHIPRKAGSSGNMYLEGDSAVTGAPKIAFYDGNPSKPNQGVLGFNDSANNFVFNRDIWISDTPTIESSLRFEMSNVSANISIAKNGTDATYLGFKTQVDGGGFDERMRIHTNGYVGIGTDDPKEQLDVRGNAAIGLPNNITDGTAPLQLYSGSGGGCVKANRVDAFYEMSLGGTTAVNSRLYTVAGGVGGVSIGQGETAWSAVSDERFKIVQGPVLNSVQRLSNINIINFKWNYTNLIASNLATNGSIDYSNLSNVVHTGVLAQQIINDFPLIVSNIGFFEGHENNPALGVKYADFVPTIIDAIGVMSSDATITNGLRIGDFGGSRKEGHMIELDGSGDYTNTSIIIHAYDTSNLEIGMSNNTEHYIAASGENTTLTLSATSNVVIDASNLEVYGNIHMYSEQVRIGNFDTINGNLFMSPLQSFSGNPTNKSIMYYDNNTKEITYKNAGPLVLQSVETTNTLEVEGNVMITGTVNALEFMTASDDTLKTIVGNLDNSLEKVISLSGFIYKYNELSGYNTESSHVGLSAQAVQSILPEAVGSSGDYLALKYDSVIPLLVEAIKELKTEIDGLKLFHS